MVSVLWFSYTEPDRNPKYHQCGIFTLIRHLHIDVNTNNQSCSDLYNISLVIVEKLTCFFVLFYGLLCLHRATI
jgi:hypothetical protein